MKAVISRKILWLLLLVVDVCLINNNDNNNLTASDSESNNNNKRHRSFFVQCMTLTNWSTLTTSPSSGGMLSERIMIPTHDPHKEAQQMYDEALKEHLGSLTTIKDICEPWQKLGCHCSGTVERVSLSCRSIGMNNVSIHFPEALIKL